MIDKPSSPSRDLLHSLTQEPDECLDRVARSVIRAAIEVHRHLAPGLQEPLYAPAPKLITAQLIAYLRSAGKRLGLLINFNVPLLKGGVRIVVFS